MKNKNRLDLRQYLILIVLTFFLASVLFIAIKGERSACHGTLFSRTVEILTFRYYCGGNWDLTDTGFVNGAIFYIFWGILFFVIKGLMKRWLSILLGLVPFGIILILSLLARNDESFTQFTWVIIYSPLLSILGFVIGWFIHPKFFKKRRR